MATRSMPPSMPTFFFRLRYIDLNLPHNVPTSSTRTDDHWRPPCNRSHFVPNNTPFQLGDREWPQDQIFRWTPGSVRPYVEADQALEPHKSVTLFWISDWHGYMLVPYDCTTRDVDEPLGSEDEPDATWDALEGMQQSRELVIEDAPKPWRRLSFRRSDRHDRLSAVGYCEEYRKLGVHVPERWESFLVPATAQTDRKPARTDGCQLVGELPVLLGIVGFTTKRHLSLGAIRDSFHPEPGNSEWFKTADMEGFDRRLEERGMVIETFYDGRPDSKRFLLDWENGQYGPILS